MPKLGIIGGSGLYKMPGINKVQELEIETPFGNPSDSLIVGELDGDEIVFLPRHGRGHSISPSEINYRANIYAMKKLGVERLVSVAACGSLRDDFKPLDFVLVDQYVDRTNQGRKMTFFRDGIVAHISFAHPSCPELGDILYDVGYKASDELKIKIHKGGTYINMEGPAFSTLAESNLYRSWGMDVIGMTNMAEAKLAREAEICYVTLACVTDFDCWHPDYEKITIEMVINNLHKNIENAKKILHLLIKRLPAKRNCACKDALKNAIITSPKMISPRIKKDLDIIIGKYIK